MLKTLTGLALVAAMALTASGCRIELTLNDKGGGTGHLAYKVTKEWELAAQKKNLESASVKVLDAKVDKEKLATFEISFDDVTKLGTTQFFKSLTLKRTVENGVVMLDGLAKPANEVKLPDAGVQYFGPDVTIVVTVPGEIVKTNAKTTEGKTATWVFPINEMLGASKDGTPMTLSYKQ